jgi:hypothetical protein
MLVLKMRSFVCVEYAVECQILFSALNASWAFRIQAVVSASLPPAPQISKLCHSFSGFAMYAESLIVHGDAQLLRLIYIHL